jgi:hypothetical protein
MTLLYTHVLVMSSGLGYCTGTKSHANGTRHQMRALGRESPHDLFALYCTVQSSTVLRDLSHIPCPIHPRTRSIFAPHRTLRFSTLAALMVGASKFKVCQPNVPKQNPWGGTTRVVATSLLLRLLLATRRPFMFTATCLLPGTPSTSTSYRSSYRHKTLQLRFLHEQCFYHTAVVVATVVYKY